MVKLIWNSHIVLLVCLYWAFPCEGSYIQMAGTPSNVKQGLTDDVSLRCSLNDTASPAGIVGRRDVTQVDDGANGIKDTPYNVDEVMSIIVTHNGKDIAALTHTHPARVLDGSTNLQISGQISKANVGQGYIELRWQQPTEAQMIGHFECQINAITDVGRTVMFSSSFSFDSSQPTIIDLVKRIQHLEAENKAMNATFANEIHELKTENHALKAEFGVLIKNNSKDISVLKSCTTPRVAFMTTTDKSTYNIPSNKSPVIFDIVLTNVGGSYNTSTGIFLCSVAGTYQFNFHGMCRPDYYINLSLNLNGDVMTSMYSYPNDKTKPHGDGSSAVMHLKEGDSVSLVTPWAMEMTSASNYARSSMFSGVLLQSDNCL